MTAPDTPIPVLQPRSACTPGCGDCCKMVALKGSHDAYRFLLEHVDPREVAEDERRNAEHVVRHMIEIPIELAVQMNERRVAQSLYNHFYLCSFYDQTNGVCKHHEERPPFCRGFPWYHYDPQDEAVQGGLGPYPRCSLWHDVPREKWPRWVTEATVLPNPNLPQSVC